MRIAKAPPSYETNLVTYSKKLRTFIYKYRHLFKFSKEIWIRIYHYLSIFNIFFDSCEPDKTIQKIPSSIRTLYVYDSYQVKDIYKVLKKVPKNIETLVSIERRYGYQDLNHSLRRDIFFLYSFQNLKKLILNGHFNEPLLPNIFPKTLKYIDLGSNFNQKLQKNIFHDGLEVIIFSESFNHPIKKGVLPDSLIRLELGERFNKAFKRNFKFPTQLKELILKSSFNQGLRYSFFPKNLESLTILNRSYSKRIKLLPRKLSELHLHNYDFDIPTKWFPLSIQKIYFYRLGGNMLMNYLSPNIKEFTIESSYNFPILFELTPYIQSYNVKPTESQNLSQDFFKYYDKITHFKIDHEMTNFHFHLPTTIKKVELCWILKSPIQPYQLSSRLTELIIHSNYKFRLQKDVLPLSLKNLTIGSYEYPLEKDILPHGLKTFDLCRSSRDYQYIIHPDILPTTLEVLKVYTFNYGKKVIIVNGSLPNKLKEFYLYGSHTDIKIGLLNPHLEKLVIDKFNQPIIPGLFPNKLKSLSFLFDFNQVIGKNVLPPKLRYLNLGNVFRHPIQKDVLPSSLIHLRIGDSFNHSLKDVLPPKIRYLRLGLDFNQEINYEQIPLLKDITICERAFTNILKNRPSTVLIHTFDIPRYPSDDYDSYGYYSDD